MRDIGKGRAKLLTLEVGCRLLCAQVDGQEEEQGNEQAAPHLRRLHSVRVACLNRRRICVFAAESKRHSLCARAARWRGGLHWKGVTPRRKRLATGWPSFSAGTNFHSAEASIKSLLGSSTVLIDQTFPAESITISTTASLFKEAVGTSSGGGARMSRIGCG